MAHPLDKETAERLNALRELQDAFEKLNDSKLNSMRSEKRYERAAKKLLRFLLGREPTQYEIHLIRDEV